MDIKIRRLHPAAQIPQYAHPGDSGFDLVAAETVEILPGQTVRVATGLAFEIPSGYEMQIRPRSGVTSKTKLRVALGTIDSSYRGEVSVIVDNVSPVTDQYEPYDWDDETDWVDDSLNTDSIAYTIEAGERLAQAIIVPVVRASFIEVDELGESARGASGFGSTGVSV